MPETTTPTATISGLTLPQRAGIRELIKNALSGAGAFCGDCGFEPGDRGRCGACERHWDACATAILPLLDTTAERVPALLADLGAKTIEIARLRAEHDRELGDVIDERDRCEDWADKLSLAIAPIEVIGEHSSGNNPWANALDLVTPTTGLDKAIAEARTATWNAAAAEADKAGGVYAARGNNDAAGAAFALMEKFQDNAVKSARAASPCLVPGCDVDDTGEPCSNHEREQSHAEGNHELCEADCPQAVGR